MSVGLQNLFPQHRPPEFERVFITTGWRGVENYYGARTSITSRWIDECGGVQALQARRKAYCGKESRITQKISQDMVSGVSSCSAAIAGRPLTPPPSEGRPAFNMREARRIAAAYPVSASLTPDWERRSYFTPIQQYAWLLRFRPDEADIYSAKHCAARVDGAALPQTQHTSGDE